MIEFVLYFLGGIFSGIIALLIQDRSIRSRLYSLESDLIDLQNRVVSEIKKRAVSSRQDRTELDVLAKIDPQQKTAQPTYWWSHLVATKDK